MKNIKKYNEKFSDDDPYNEETDFEDELEDFENDNDRARRFRERYFNKIEYVYVITNTESGWDCVVGAHTTKEAAERFLNEEIPARHRRTYVIHTTILNR